ncbi:MAG: hypothetical protein KC646_12900 [Candidatus Cloacimonetes bacterium]|nr:hypothetical protein [Candidatus Cloacimonadota bacterium]
MKFLSTLIFLVTLSFNFANKLNVLPTLLPLDVSQSHFSNHQLISQVEFQKLLDQYNQQVQSQKIQSAKYSLTLKKTEQNVFEGTFVWDLSYSTFDPNQSLALVPRSWVLTNNSSLQNVETDSKHFKIPLSQKMKGQVSFLIESPGYFDLPPVALTQVKVIGGDQFTLQNPYNKKQFIDLQSEDIFYCGGLNALQISNTLIKSTTPKKVDPIQPKVEVMAPVKISGLKASILSKPLYQVDVKKNEIVIQGKLNINVLHQKIYSLKHSFSKDLQLKRLSFEPSIPFNFDSKQIIFPDGFMGQINLNFIQSIPKKQLVDGFSLPHLIDASLFKGVLYFISSENVKINSIENVNLVKLPYLKDQSLDNYNLPILKSFEFHKRLGKIQLKSKTFAQQKSSQLKVLDTTVSSILTEEFRLANSYSFKVLNLGASNFVFDIPPQVQFLGSYINNKPVKPFRNDKAQIAINLPKDKRLTIAIKTLETLDKDHQLSLYMPTKEESLRTRWNFYYPKALNIQAIGSNLSYKKIQDQGLIKNYANFVLRKFFKSTSSTFECIVVIFVPLLALLIFLKIVSWIFNRFTTKKSASKIKWGLAIFIIGVVIIIPLFILSPIGNSVKFRGDSSNFRSYPRSQAIKADQNNLDFEDEFDAFEPEESITSSFDGDSFGDDFGGLAEGIGAKDKYRPRKGRKNVYAPPAPPYPGQSRSKANQELNMLKEKRESVSRQRSSSLRGYRSKKAVRAYKQSLPKREKKSKYKKIRKSGVKPVEIQFPKLSSKISFGKNTPIDGLVFIKLSIKDFQKSNTLLISSIFSILYLAIFLYLERKQKLGLLGFLSVLMLLSPAGQFMFMTPEPLFFVLAIIIINSFARICKNSMVVLSLLLCIQANHASKEVWSQNIQQSHYHNHRIQAPKTEKIYTIFDFKKNDFQFENQLLVKDHLLNKLQKNNKVDKNLLEVESQAILLRPNFKEKKLNVFYSFAISKQHEDSFYLLRLNKKSLISQCIDQNGDAIQLEIKYKKGYAYLYVKDFKGKSIHLQIESPLISKNYGDDFHNEVTLALTSSTTLDYKKDQYYLKVSNAIKQNQQHYLSSKKTKTSIHFSKYPFKVEKVKSVQKQKSYKRYVNSRVTKSSKSKIHFSQKISFATPYLIVKNFVRLSNKDSFQLRLPKDASLSQFQVKHRYTTLKQGEDYSLSYKDNQLHIDLIKSYSEVTVSYRHFQNQDRSQFYIPFSPKEFKETIFKLEKESKEGQDIQFKLQDSLSQTASKSYQSKVLEFENLPQSLSDTSQFEVKVKSKSFVSFSKTQCISYKIENYLLSKDKIYQKLVLTLSNKESQFLELNLPDGTVLEEALIDGKHLNIVKKDDKNLLLPLKKYKKQRNFNITLLFKATLSQSGDQFSLKLPRLKTDIKNLYFALTTDKNMYKFSDENPIRISQKYNMNGFVQRVRSTDSFDFQFPRGRYYYTGARNGVDSEINIQFEEIPEKKEKQANTVDYFSILCLFIVAIVFQLSLPFFKVRVALSIVAILFISTVTSSLQYFYLALIIAYLGYINNKKSDE